MFPYTRENTWLNPNLKEKGTYSILSLADFLLWQHSMPLATIRHTVILTAIRFQLWHKTPLMPEMYIPIRKHILMAFPPLFLYYSAYNPNRQALFHMCDLPCNVLWSQARQVIELWLWIPHQGQTSYHHMTKESPNLILKYSLKHEIIVMHCLSQNLDTEFNWFMVSLSSEVLCIHIIQGLALLMLS